MTVASTTFKYGDQQLFHQKIKEMIDWGAKKIKTAPKTKDGLKTLFFELFEQFQTDRASLAKSQGSWDAEQFGSSRNSPGTKDFYQTILDQNYTKYNKAILSRFVELMKDLPLISKEHGLLILKKEENFEDSTSSFEIEILEHADIISKNWHIPPAQNEIPVNLEASEMMTEKEKVKRHADVLNLKKSNFQLYTRIKMCSMILHLQKEFPSPKTTILSGRKLKIDGDESNLKSFYVLGTFRIGVKGKNYAATQYLTWLYRDGVDHPLKRMENHSKVMLIHQDKFLIQETLEEIAEIFAKAILAENLSEAQKQTALFRLYFSHCMPHERGSAAIAECYEQAMYEARGQEVTYDPEQKVDLEAFAALEIKRFVDKYSSLVKLRAKKISKEV